MPPERVNFVFLDDLECLDLWLRCAAHLSPKPTGFTRIAEQLRDNARRYIGQFSLTVTEPEGQKLALELLDALQTSPGQAVAAAAG